MHRGLATLVLLAAVAVLGNVPGAAGDEAAKQVRKAFSMDLSQINPSWVPEVPLADWPNVKTHAGGLFLRFEFLGITGMLTIAELPMVVTELDVSHNRLSGIDFTNATHATNISVMHLNNNEKCLVNPNFFALMPRTVVQMNFASTYLMFPIQSFALLPPNMTAISLTNCFLTGTPDLSSLPRGVQYVNLNQNIFTGSIDLTHLPPQLRLLDVSWNQLQGTVDLTHLPAPLVALFINNNMLGGSLVFESMPATMESLYISNNYFVGQLNDLSGLPQTLTRFDISHNHFYGAIGLSDNLPPPLEYLDISNNFFSGDVSFFGLATEVKTMYLGHNMFNGAVLGQPALRALTKLTQLDMSGNKLIGGLDLAYLPSSMVLLNASGNRFNGSVNLTVLPPLFQILDISHNEFSGPLSFPLHWTSDYIYYLYLNNNRFQGLVNLERLPPSVYYVSIQNNDFDDRVSFDHLPLGLRTLIVPGAMCEQYPGGIPMAVQCYGSYHPPPCPKYSAAVPNTTICVACPKYATCNGTDILLSDKSVWRPNTNMLPFVQCAPGSPGCDCHNQLGACDGTHCVEGYTGPLCAVCAEGYGGFSGNCGRCPSTKRSIGIVAVFTFVAIAYITFAVFRSISQSASPVAPATASDSPPSGPQTLDANGDLQEHYIESSEGHTTSTYRRFVDNARAAIAPSFDDVEEGGSLGTSFAARKLSRARSRARLIGSRLPLGIKMLLNHFVLVGILSRTAATAQAFGAPWYLMLQLQIGGASPAQSESFACVSFSSAIDRFIMMVVGTPAIVVLEVVVVALLRVFTSRRLPPYPFFCVVVCVGQIMYTTFVEFAADLIPCDELSFYTIAEYTNVMNPDTARTPAERFHLMQYDRSVSCTSPRYKDSVAGAYLALAVYGVLFPFLFVLAYKWLERRETQAAANTTFAFMTRNFKRDMWFWESILMVRKLIGFLILALVSDVSVQLNTINMYILLCFAIHFKFHPYAYSVLNLAEHFSIVTAWLSTCCITVAANYSQHREAMEISMLVANGVGMIGILTALAIYIGLGPRQLCHHTVVPMSPDRRSPTRRGPRSGSDAAEQDAFTPLLSASSGTSPIDSRKSFVAEINRRNEAEGRLRQRVRELEHQLRAAEQAVASELQEAFRSPAHSARGSAKSPRLPAAVEPNSREFRVSSDGASASRLTAT